MKQEVHSVAGVFTSSPSPAIGRGKSIRAQSTQQPAPGIISPQTIAELAGAKLLLHASKHLLHHSVDRYAIGDSDAIDILLEAMNGAMPECSMMKALIGEQP